MASHDADSPQPEANNLDEKKVNFRFCRECSNLLYPKEDRMSNSLLFACRTCHFSEPATTALIYRNSLKEEIAETAGNVEDVVDDPTDEAAEAMMCTLCGEDIRCFICDTGIEESTPLTFWSIAIVNEPTAEMIAAESRERALHSPAADS